MALIDIARNNIAKQISEKNEQRLRRKRKNRKVPNLAFRGRKAHLPTKFSTESHAVTTRFSTGRKNWANAAKT